ncbi:MAG: iron-containing redox enzyme family protein [Jatrophihabitans sp.]
MSLPTPCGTLTSAVLEALRADDPAGLPTTVPALEDPLADDDVQLALWVCYELHYQGFKGVPDRWEWEPALIGLRRELETIVLAQLRAVVNVLPSADHVARRLRDLVEGDDGPQLSRYLQSQSSWAQFVEFAKHRSIYQLKEADPHTWAIPRLRGRAKAALVEIQFDEYGDGDGERMHSELYRAMLRELGLSDRYGAYVDDVPGITLALSNVMSMFGLRRDLRGALAGHLAAYEMTSSGPCRRYSKALRRHGGSAAACAFYDVHVTADALHEQLAAHDLCGSLAADEPDLAEDIVFGAAACLYVDRRFAEHLIGRWDAGQSSLRPAPSPAGARSLAVAS